MNTTGFRHWMLSCVLTGALLVGTVFSGQAKDTTVKPAAASLPGQITLEIKKSSKCVGSVVYDITYSAPTDRGMKKLQRQVSSGCHKILTVKNLPVNGKAKIKAEWSTSKPGTYGRKRMNVFISPNPRKNRFVIQ